MSTEKRREELRASGLGKSSKSKEDIAYWTHYQEGVSLSDLSEKAKKDNEVMKLLDSINDPDVLTRAKARGLRDGLRWATLTRSFVPIPLNLLDFDCITGGDLRNIRKRLGISSQEELALLVGTEPQNISNMERGRKKVQWGERVAILLIDKFGQRALDIINESKSK